MSDFSDDDGLDEYFANLSDHALENLGSTKPSTGIVSPPRLIAPSSQLSRPSTAPLHSTPNQTTLTTNYASTPTGWEYTPTPSTKLPPNTTPTHHELDPDALSIYIYPTNLPIREYQLNIVKKALFENVLCALPTGLGKTFIASTVMLNYYRWTRSAKIVFMAPTRPLVSQQLEACLGITGIPRDDSSILIGGALTPAMREVEWANKRVFFVTPQTIDNDLKKGIVDPKTIACLVIDEAHRATGNQAYVEVVRFLNRFNPSFRVLALTATPSTTLEGVQAVVSNLNISSVEIRTEDSPDIKPYVHKKKIDTLVSELSEDQLSVLTPFCLGLQPLVDEVTKAKVFYINDAVNVNQFVAVNAMKSVMKAGGGGAQFKYMAILKVLASMGHALNLLKFHGITPFYNYITSFEAEALAGTTGKSKGPSKWVAMLLTSDGYKKSMARCKQLIYMPGEILLNRKFLGHPKLENLVRVAGEFFGGSGNTNTNADSKAIIFSAYRDSGAEILRVLQENVPACKPHLFIGQAAGRSSTTEDGDVKKGSAGMTQKEQQKVVAMFKSPSLNTLIATSIGEEGLDIGEVDLIICYDASSSPIRMLQRIGRTGRKRDGQIYMLVSASEEKKLERSFDNYKYIQDVITGSIGNGSDEQIEYRASQKILPQEVLPECVEMNIDIPEENQVLLQSEDIIKVVELTQKATQKAKKSGNARKGTTRTTKAVKKKFNMPDNVQTGFLSARKAIGTHGVISMGNLSDDLKSSDDDMGPLITASDFAFAGKPRSKKAPKVQPTKTVKATPSKPKTTLKTKTKATNVSGPEELYYYDPERDGPDYGIISGPKSVPSVSTTSGGSSFGITSQRRSSKRFESVLSTIQNTSEEDVQSLKANLNMADVNMDSYSMSVNGKGGSGVDAPKARTGKRNSEVLILSSDGNSSVEEVEKSITESNGQKLRKRKKPRIVRETMIISSDDDD